MTLRIPDRRFLSTPSARRATIALCHFVFSLGISIHALREEGDFSDVVKQRVNFFISIHALREEGDFVTSALNVASSDFYPRPPRGGRRGVFYVSEITPEISIHALREEGDAVINENERFRNNFYPRPPRGGRPENFPHGGRSCWISIHALREEGDERAGFRSTSSETFLSTPSARRATEPRAGRAARGEFLSTPSARRAT